MSSKNDSSVAEVMLPRCLGWLQINLIKCASRGEIRQSQTFIYIWDIWAYFGKTVQDLWMNHTNKWLVITAVRFVDDSPRLCLYYYYSFNLLRMKCKWWTVWVDKTWVRPRCCSGSWLFCWQLSSKGRPNDVFYPQDSPCFLFPQVLHPQAFSFGQLWWLGRNH